MRPDLAFGLKNLVAWSFVAVVACDRAAPSATQAAPMRFKTPYLSCVDATEDSSLFADERICTQVDVGGSTALGHLYPANLCSDVRSLGRPYRPVPVPHRTADADPRLNDKKFMGELSWVTSQIASSACVCCHSSATDGHAAMWDISLDKIWTDQLTPRGVAILSGRLDSDAFGHLPAADNNGFDRSQTGAPTTDIARMRGYFDAELTRRGITAEEIAKMTPLSIPHKKT